MKILMLASFYYPINDVSSLRIHSYCKALADIGVDITVLIIYPLKNFKGEKSGSFEGVKYEFLSNPTDYYGNLFLKVRTRILGLINILSFIKKRKVDIVISYHDNFLTNIVVALNNKLIRIPYVLDKTEYPYGYGEMSILRRFWTHVNLKLFDGFIVISKELGNFYKTFSDKIFHLPMTIPQNRFSDVEKLERGSDFKPYIALTFGTHNRDNIIDSIKAYEIYTKKRVNKSVFNLVLIGDIGTLVNNYPENKFIFEFVKDKGLSDNVLFLGKKSIDEVPKILASANCLITTPKKYVSGGFPTKLGEYMLSGVPIIATKAGELSDFVSDRVELLLVEIGNINEVAERICEIQDNPDFGVKLAEEALKSVRYKFNASTYIDRMILFFEEVKNEK